MRLVRVLLCAIAVWGTSRLVLAEQPAPSGKIPMYVTPYYESNGVKISVGPFSKPLADATKDTITDVAAEMKKHWNTLPVEAMYVLSIRLYDLGHKDESVYWFYAAQWRGPENFAVRIGDEGFERAHAYAAFQELAGIYINGYAFGDLPKLQKTLDQVKADCAKVPATVIIPALWAEKNKEVAAGFDKLQQTIRDQADEIKATREKNGVEGRF
jgi:hypothetical protein